ncbi:MAG: DUF2239 family protein, partial [Gemmatimonadetes bacterium]|nr:DUF2239 family protein [Gemmatimonadota bacterium]
MQTTAHVPSFVAFASGRLIAKGSILEVARAAKEATDAGTPRAVQVFEDRSAQPVDLDLGGSLEDVLARLAHRDDLGVEVPTRNGNGAHAVPVGDAAAAPVAVAAPARVGPGRPKLGVVAREVTLLPRHWSWLNEQPGGAS